MARRSAVEHGRDTAVVEEAAGDRALDPWDAPDQGRRWDEPEQGRRRGRGGGRWGGAGGRMWVWIGRAILWSVLLVILVNGIRAPFERFTADSGPSSGGTAATAAAGFPTGEAGAFATRFAHVYLNYDQRNAGARENQLRQFLPEGTDGRFGWNGAGQLSVQSVQMAGVQVHDAHNATVTVLAHGGDKWFRLAVPVYADKGALVVSGKPALLPQPARATLPQPGVRERDEALENELKTALGSFFEAYAQGNQETLARFSAGPAIQGLGGAVTYTPTSVQQVVAPRGAADQRTVTVTVAWQIPGGSAGGTLEQDYRLDMVRKGGTWYVKDIRGTTEPNAT
ncbi:conjugal transfer protein [Actinomadura kijaniata]|uniref:conjugal transfer protein n=1 Tax=Actinomadura kijaniata TaxID=46161 RepID=UPI00082DBBA9|nr:conjugal transfer protein [Actinomadura kijaniata]